VSSAAPEPAGSGAALGYGALVATAGAALIAIPAALRAASGGAALPMAWLALWGGAALMLGPVAAALRAARPLSPFAWSLPLGVCLSLAPLMLLARVLKTATHHRPLGGATFAFVAAFVVVGAVALAARVIAWSRSRSGASARVPLVLGAGGAALAVPLALPLLGAGARGGALDGALAFAVVLVAALVPELRALGRRAPSLGAAAWIVAVALGLGVGLGGAETRAAVAERAPVLLGLAGWLRP
jgi:hypothetical protein